MSERLTTPGRRPRLHINARIDAAAIAALRRDFDVTLGFGDGGVPVEQVIGELDALVVRKGPVPNDLLDRARQLRILVRAGIGLEGVDLEHAQRRGIAVRNTPGSNARSVAEHTVALALAAAKGIVEWDALTRAGHAGRRDEAPVRELAGKSWGIVGYGRIGREVATMAGLGLAMQVLVSPRPGSRPGGGLVEGAGLVDVQVADDLDDLLARADVVSLHVPLTPATEGLIGARELALMRRTAVLVNVARGAVVDATALLQALTERSIAAAALDVWDGPFPVPPHPLYDAPHLVLAPHRAGRTVEADAATGRAVVAELSAAFAGERTS